MPAKVSVLACFACLAAAAAAPAEELALLADDECLGEAECGLNALQLRSAQVEAKSSPDWTDVTNSSTPEGDVVLEGQWVPVLDDPDDVEGDVTLEGAYGGGWYVGGDKYWGHGAGIENVNGGNVAYYDSGMSIARSRCGGPGCALIINPPGHRTVNTVHIHVVHYHGSYASSLKSRLEAATCTKPNQWQHGHFPCHGKAAFFHGSPGVFSKAMTSGSIKHATVVAWPSACGGVGTIVEVGYGCSIEHQIRGDFDPSRR